MAKKVLAVIGSGGREHAMVWKLAKSPEVGKIYCLPGNGGIASIAGCMPKITAEDIDGILSFVKEKKVDYTIVGPEAPLVAGITEKFQSQGLKIYGPTSSAARFEGSKVFSKMFMTKHGIPTAAYREVKTVAEGDAAIAEMFKTSKGVVVKADGLAAGKGVIVCDTPEQASTAVRQMVTEKQFGSAGDVVLIEQRWYGEEATILAFCDGETLVPMLPSQDHKRVYDDDKGPNTGGMGAYVPAPVIDIKMWDKVKARIFNNFLTGLKKENIVYHGVIYFGLMIVNSDPYLIEFNCRFGDPECQVALPALEDDLMEIIELTAEKKLYELKPEFSKLAAVCIVLASGGYPGSYVKGKVITGLDAAAEDSNVTVFHAGTVAIDGKILTSGGRVLGVTGVGKDIREAVNRAYSAVSKISFDGMHYRKDIAARALKRI
ncbi:MAG: phosphoribosylamine--glycine ligase [Elusimicrobiota bacterium]